MSQIDVLKDEEDRLGDGFVPHVAHDRYKEITVRGVILSVVLAVVLGAANVYLGLLVGLTVSASIPASVISMSCLKMFKDSNILENNIVQTAASAGESLAAAVIFTLPALTILNRKSETGEPGFEDVYGWDTFMGSNYFYTTFLAMFGGIAGIGWSTILRGALIVDRETIKPPLKFPEGQATSTVLLAGEEGGSSAFAVLAGAILGLVTKLLEVMGIFSSVLGGGWFYNNMYPTYLGLNVSGSLMGVGYIIGPQIAAVLLLGSLMQFLVTIPLSALAHDRYHESEWNVSIRGEFTPMNVAMSEFSETRYIGIGLMILGGVWSLFTIRKAIFGSVKIAYRQFRNTRSEVTGEKAEVKRYEKDLPFQAILGMIIGSMIPLYIIFSIFSGHEWGYCLVMALFVAILSGLFSCVAAYMAGLVGSSNNPISGTVIVSSLVIASLVLAMFGQNNPIGPAIVVVCCAAVASACAISGDNLQDLMCGRIVGATPMKQELIMIVGVVSTSFVVAPILELLDKAYGLGVGLAAPQASIIATIPVGIINGTLEWTFISIGVGLGAVIIIIDEVLKHKGFKFRLPVLSFAVAFYLPCEYLISIFIGSCVHLLARTSPEDQAAEGVLYAAGLVAGDSLMGILMAIPIVVSSNGDVMKMLDEPVPFLGILFLFLIFGSMFYIGKFEPFGKMGKTNDAETIKGTSFDREHAEEQSTSETIERTTQNVVSV